MSKETFFYFSEVSNLNSYREAEPLKANTLAEAKKEASRTRAYLWTYLYIGTYINEQGFIIDPVAVKTKEGWRDITD